MMITREMVYEDKRRFVKKLEEALLCLDDIRGIEYRVSDEMYIELVRVDWHGEGDLHIYLDVTMKSLSEIVVAVILELTVFSASEELSDTAEGDKLWEELGNEMDRKDATEV